MIKIDFFDKVLDCCCINILERVSYTWSTFHKYSLDYSILVGYAWLLEKIYIHRRVVGYHLLVDIYE